MTLSYTRKNEKFFREVVSIFKPMKAIVDSELHISFFILILLNIISLLKAFFKLYFFKFYNYYKKTLSFIEERYLGVNAGVKQRNGAG